MCYRGQVTRNVHSLFLFSIIYEYSGQCATTYIQIVLRLNYASNDLCAVIKSNTLGFFVFVSQNIYSIISFILIYRCFFVCVTWLLVWPPCMSDFTDVYMTWLVIGWSQRAAILRCLWYKQLLLFSTENNVINTCFMRGSLYRVMGASQSTNFTDKQIKWVFKKCDQKWVQMWKNIQNGRLPVSCLIQLQNIFCRSRAVNIDLGNVVDHGDTTSAALLKIF